MTRSALLALSLLGTATEASEDHCAGLIPAEAAEAATEAFPFFRMPKSSDNSAEDVEYVLSQQGTGCLGVAQGDFDGDGRGDHLIGMTARDDSGAAAVVIVLDRGHGWILERLTEWSDGRSRLYVEAGTAGTYARTLSLDGPPTEAGEVESLNCPHDVAILGVPESSAVAFCHVESEWQYVQISD